MEHEFREVLIALAAQPETAADFAGSFFLIEKQHQRSERLSWIEASHADQILPDTIAGFSV